MCVCLCVCQCVCVCVPHSVSHTPDKVLEARVAEGVLVCMHVCLQTRKALT